MNFRSLTLLLTLLFALPVHADGEAPDALVNRVSGEVLQILQGSSAAPGSAEVIAQVKEKILPHFDFSRMTALATGIGWRTASAGQNTRRISVRSGSPKDNRAGRQNRPCQCPDRPAAARQRPSRCGR